MKKLNIKTKEIQLLVLFGVLTLLFISVNFANNYSPQGNYIFDDKLPRSAAISINIVSPTTNDNFSATAPDFVVEIDDPVNPIDTMWYNLNGGTNITFIVNGTIDQNNWTALVDGPVTINFYANNSISEIETASVTVNKDIVAPVVIVTTPAGGEYFNATAPDYVVEISDSGSSIDTMWYTLNGGANITFLANGTIDQNNWTALANGPVTIIFYANDSAGNSDSDTVVVNKDAGNPSVSITSPTGGEYFDATAPDFVVEISDSESPIDTMWYTLNGGANIIFLANGTIDQNNWTALVNGPVTIIFYANDSAGNANSAQVVVNKDTGNPTVSITSPTGGEYFGATAPDFVVEISDSESPIDTMWYTLNGGANIIFLANGTIDQNNWTALVNGPVTIIFYANDSAGNVDFDTVNVNKDATDPTVTITSPTGGEYFDANAPGYIVEISDSDSPIHTMWYTLNGGANIIFLANGTIDQNNWTALFDGPVTIIFYANDSAGNIGSDIRLINKDTAVPTFNIISPLPGQTFGVAAPNFIIEIDDDTLHIMWYNLNGGVNITFVNNGTIDQNNWTALANGLVTLTFFANDTFGHFNSTSVNFNKNADAPVINIVSPTSDSYFGIMAPDFIVEIIDDDLDTMWYSLNGGVNITFLSNGTIDQNNWTALSDGPVTIRFYANDTVGNFASSIRLINKDTVAPTVNLVSPTLLQLLGVNSPSFIVEIDDPILDTMWYTLDNGLNNYTFLVNGTFNQLAWDSVLNGTVTIYFYANDLVGNEAFDSILVRVDKIIPTIKVNLPVDDDTIGTPPYINITVNDVNVHSIWYRVGITVIILPLSANNTDQLLNLLIWNALPEGSFTIEFFANDTAGNLNSLYSVNLIKDISAPIVDIVHPLPNATSTSAPQITLIINDATLDTTWYSIVGTTYTFEFTATIGTNYITIDQAAWDSLSEGVVTIIFYANDSLGRISSDSITLNRVVPEVFDLIAFLTNPLVLTIIGVAAIAIVAIVIIVKRRKFHRTSDKEVRRIGSLWD